MNAVLKFGLFFLINYLVGSIPFALVIGKLFYNRDIRLFGSGNLGATNAGRVLGKKVAIMVFIGDALKGFLLYIVEQAVNPDIALYGSIFTVLGHCYPVFAKLKGGKAVSTTLGIFLAMSLSSFTDFIFILTLPASVWALVFYSTRYVSLASCICVVSSSLFQFLFLNSLKRSVLSAVLAAIVLIRHSANIRNLLNGSENRTYLSERSKARAAAKKSHWQ